MIDVVSHNPFSDPTAATLQDVLDGIRANELPGQRRRNILSGIRTLCKTVGKTPSQMPAHPGMLRRVIKRLHFEQCDLTRSRIANIKSDILFALKRLNLIHGARGYMATFSPEWQTLWDAAQNICDEARYASRLMHYCSAQGILPPDVDDSIAELLLRALVDESFVKNPRQKWKSILHAWNKLVDLVPEWPQTKLTVPNDRNDYTIPLERFPLQIQREIEAMVESWSGTDILDDAGPPTPLAPATIKTRILYLRQILSALVLQGRDIDEMVSIAQVVEIKEATIILRFYLKRSGGKPTSRTHGLAILIKTLAKHWVKVDDIHLDALKDLCKKVDPNIVGMTDKNRDRLRPFDDPRNVRLLLDFPARQVETVLRNKRVRRNDAIAVQIALAVEILLMAPMRANNLANLHIERHIQRTRAASGTVHIVIPGEETKNGDPLEYPLPPESVKLLDLYLQDFRPMLCSGVNPWLFPGAGDDAPKSAHTLGIQIKASVFKATGLEVNTHLFRHIAAKLYLDQNPGQYEIVRRHLGHRSMNSTVRFYAGMETASASRHFDDEILKLRDSLRKKSA